MTRDRKPLVGKAALDGSYAVIDRNAGNITLVALQELKLKRQLCDVVLQVEGGEIWAHRVILAVSSDYFRVMFTERFQEISSLEISLNSVSLEAVQILVDFMYTGNLTVTKKNVVNLMTTADQWQMSSVKEMCCQYIERHLDNTNCIGALELAEQLSIDSLYLKSMQMLKQHFPVVTQLSQFLSVTVARLIWMLSLEDLRLGPDGEDVVLDAVFRWVCHDPEDRMLELRSLLPYVYLSATSQVCRDRVLSYEFTMYDPELKKTFEQYAKMPKRQRQPKTSLYVIGGFSQSHSSLKSARNHTAERLDATVDQWKGLAELPRLGEATVTLNLDSHLVCLAREPIDLGDGGVPVEMGIFEYNFALDAWVDARAHFSDTVLGSLADCLEAAGAIAVCQETKTIYAVSSNEVCSMRYVVIDGDLHCHTVSLLPRPSEFFPEGQSGFSAVVLNRRLYILGGDGRSGGTDPIPSSLVITFDPEQNKWIRKANMLHPRIKMGAAVLDGQIYVCGGFNTRRISAMECYDVREDTWRELNPMKCFRSHHQLVAMDHKLWAIGGKSLSVTDRSVTNVVKTVEVFDPSTDTWSEGPSMIAARCDFVAVAV